MKCKIVSIVFCIVIFVVLSSCVEDLDFNQADDIELTPTYIGSLIYSNLPQTSLVSPTGIEVSRISDVTRVEIFENSVTDRLKKVDIDFEITNPFDRRFTIDFRFLNQANDETYRIPQIEVNQNVSKYKVKEEIILSDNSAILNSTKIEVTVELLPSADGSIIDINDDKTFIFKSAGTFYFGIN
ncbi:hypothetical protein [Tenacibaculum sp. MAR_2009_124]|uniref:hypothetical protein n=1 Tax=Tenacibaculum sp. MAR_2009_124 TaxID=1250059 RepID=UPI00115F9EF8|nr:hypothetical protein [Tenacibaculum sp. MAR_2009_124]